MTTQDDNTEIHTEGKAAQRDRARGALLGLAVGDALGTTLEFRSPGNFTPIDDMSMALCPADSLLECSVCDPVDQMQRYRLDAA